MNKRRENSSAPPRLAIGTARDGSSSWPMVSLDGHSLMHFGWMPIVYGCSNANSPKTAKVSDSLGDYIVLFCLGFLIGPLMVCLYSKILYDEWRSRSSGAICDQDLTIGICGSEGG